MATAAESWYVRLPDGRTLRARNAEILRSYLSSGRIPLESRVRRSGEEEWQPLQRVAEFADALGSEKPRPVEIAEAPSPSRSSNELPTVGVRGLVEELLNALDSSLNRAKLTTAAMTGVLLAVGAIALELVGSFPFGPWTLAGYLATALFLLCTVALGTVLLTQMTYIELDRHRPARSAEVRAGLVRQTLRVLFAQSLVAGLLVGLVLCFRTALPWLTEHDDLNPYRPALLSVIAVLRLLLEVVCWPVLGLAVLLLGPLLVIEELSIVQSLREWLGMIRQHLGRVYLYEALALTLAAVLALPMLLLVAIAAYSVGSTLGLPERIALLVLAGVALTPSIAYLPVANVFIYLNLRYEFFQSPREK
jgi:hypothetical protein